MSETSDKFLCINNIAPDSKRIEEKTKLWEKIFNQFSNCNDTDKEGILLDDFTCEELDEETESESLPEAVEESYPTDQKFAVYNGSFVNLTHKEKYSRLSFEFEKIFLDKLIGVFKQRFSELDKKNLPFWKISTESLKVTESSKEQWISTPQLSITTRQTHRSREMNKTMAEVGFNHPVLRYDRFNINGNQLAPSNVSTMDTTDTTSSFQLPDALKQLIGTKSNYTLKIVERQFDISVRDGKVSTVQALEDAPARGLSKAKPSQANNQKVFFSPQKVLTLKKTIAKKKLPVKNDETMRNMRKAKNVEEPHKEVKEYKKKLKSVSEEKIEHEKKQTKRTQVMRRGRSAAVTANVQKDALMALKENFKKIVTAEEIVTKPVEFSNQDIIMTNSSDLQLVDISCGSSCSTVTSGDEKYYDPKKYTDLRRKKKYLHRRKKLLERTKSTCPISDTETQVKSCVTKAKLDKIEEDSYSSDDFFFKKEPMTKRPSPVKVKAPEAKKVQVISLIDSDSDF